jgi:phage shock protein A
MLASNQAFAEEWQKKAEAALQAGKEDLAKQALMRRRAYQELADNYRQQFELQSQQVEELQGALAKLEAKISEARARKEIIVAKKHQAETQEAIVRTVRTIGDSGRALEGLSGLEERVDDRLSKAKAMAKLEGQALETRLTDVELEAAADADLAALKKKMGMTS